MKTGFVGGAAPALALALAVSVLAFDDRADAQAGAPAWKAGKVFVPASLTVSGNSCESEPGGACEADIKPGKHPVVVFLHGCGGPRSPATFTEQGAIVVAPDSFAGGKACKADAKYMVEFLALRHADTAYAASQLAAAAWADPAKLILAGYSNGAQTTATYPGEEFKARIIVAWTCNNKREPSQNGVRGKGPVLALIGTADEYYKKIGLSGDCGAAVKNRGAPSKSILIKGGTHEILDHAETRAAVKAFLAAAIK